MIGLSTTNSFSQDVSDSTKVVKKYYLVVKNDGSEYYGYIIKDDGREILLQTGNIGKMYINKSDIDIIREVDEPKVGSSSVGDYSDLRKQGPFTTRYYFTTNALPIKKKENYALIHLYGPEVHFAVTDNLSVGVMATWIASPIAVAVKYSFKNSNPDSDIHFALGTIVGSGGYLMPQTFGGLYFATITKGNRSSNISFSAGYGHINLGSNSRSVSKYKYQNYDSEGEYFVPNDYYINIEDEYLTSTSNNNGSLVFGLSGITSVGKKASFIFDSMIFITKGKIVTYNDTSLPFTNITTSTTKSFTVGIGSFVNGYKPTVVLMPGMRFNRSNGRAIQVVLAGAIFESDGDYIGRPIPMVSWLKAF